MLIASPFAGALVDRSSRKLMMMVSDIASSIASLIILILFSTGHLQIWHLFITSAFEGVFQSFQWPAYSAAISTMIPKQHYGRANGMLSLADTASNIFDPILAGSLLGIIGFSGILMIDLATFIFAIGALLFVHIPQPRVTEEGRQAKGNIFKEAGFGFRYILSRASLLGLQLVFLTGNFFGGIPGAVQAAMIRANTGSNEKALAGLPNPITPRVCWHSKTLTMRCLSLTRLMASIPRQIANPLFHLTVLRQANFFSNTMDAIVSSAWTISPS